jgi:addiction module HigA family antidote
MEARIHPGVLLRDEVLPALGISVTQAAVDLLITRQTLHRVLAGTAGVTAEMAVRLNRLTGVPAATWLRLQEGCDLQRAETRLGDDVRRIPYRILPAELADRIQRRARAARPVMRVGQERRAVSFGAAR